MSQLTILPYVSNSGIKHKSGYNNHLKTVIITDQINWLCPKPQGLAREGRVNLLSFKSTPSLAFPSPGGSPCQQPPRPPATVSYSLWALGWQRGGNCGKTTPVALGPLTSSPRARAPAPVGQQGRKERELRVCGHSATYSLRGYYYIKDRFNFLKTVSLTVCYSFLL